MDCQVPAPPLHSHSGTRMGSLLSSQLELEFPLPPSGSLRTRAADPVIRVRFWGSDFCCGPGPPPTAAAVTSRCDSLRARPIKRQVRGSPAECSHTSVAAAEIPGEPRALAAPATRSRPGWALRTRAHELFSPLSQPLPVAAIRVAPETETPPSRRTNESLAAAAGARGAVAPDPRLR